jgi:hypothetical protein
MAQIEVTEDVIRDWAGEAVSGRAMSLAGKVSGLSATGPLIEAAVDGQRVSVRVMGTGLAAECGCPEPAPCAHAAGAALAWVRAGEDRQETGLYELLRVRDREWLARQLADLAAADPELALRLADAARDGGDDVDAAADVASLLAEVEDELTGLGAEAAEEPEYEEWYPDTGDLEEMADEAEDYLDEAPDAVRELAARAIALADEVLDYQNCYGADFTSFLDRMEDLHLAACKSGTPDQRTLAEWLFNAALHSGWNSLASRLPGYAEVLGTDGLARYRELLVSATGGSEYKLETMREALARAERP